jgi:hypothetical protein
MWSFIGIFMLVLAGLVLLSHPFVAKFMNALMVLAVLLVITVWASLLIWLALSGRG